LSLDFRAKSWKTHEIVMSVRLEHISDTPHQI